ncbi:acetyl-coenzyme A synthetase N-terminal domain-containing protein, partial [Vibrio rotiferianus]
MSAYQKEYLWAQNEPENFWRAQAENIDWFEAPNTILQADEHGIERWFPDGVLNTSWLALDYHCEQGRGDKTALIYDSPVTGQKQTYSYQALRDQVAKIAGMLSNQGVTKGDRV